MPDITNKCLFEVGKKTQLHFKRNVGTSNKSISSTVNLCSFSSFWTAGTAAMLVSRGSTPTHVQPATLARGRRLWDVNEPSLANSKAAAPSAGSYKFIYCCLFKS